MGEVLMHPMGGGIGSDDVTAAVTVATSIKSQTASATFTGTSGTAVADYTPTGTVSKPTFTGSSATVTVK